MTKWLSLTLAIVMAVLLVGCNDEQGDGKGKKELSRGKIEESVYTNEYLGFKFTKPESWVFSTDEEIAEAVGLDRKTVWRRLRKGEKIVFSHIPG